MTSISTMFRHYCGKVSNFNYFCALTKRMRWGQCNITQIIGRCLLISSALCLLSSCENKVRLPRDAKKYSYEGHSYVFFLGWNEMAVIHDPDCKCKDKHD